MTLTQINLLLVRGLGGFFGYREDTGVTQFIQNDCGTFLRERD